MSSVYYGSSLSGTRSSYSRPDVHIHRHKKPKPAKVKKVKKPVKVEKPVKAVKVVLPVKPPRERKKILSLKL